MLYVCENERADKMWLRIYAVVDCVHVDQLIIAITLYIQ